MKYSIVLTETAQADLSAIFRYIAVDLQSVQNANAQLSRYGGRDIDRQLEILETE